VKPLTRMELMSLMAAEGFDPAILEPGAGAGDPSSPWFVRVLVGFGAWVAGLMIAGGLTVFLSLQRGGNPLAVTGLLLCAGACALRWASRGDFPVQLALAGSVAGQVMVAVGIMDYRGMEGDRAFLWGMLVLEALLVVLFRDARHRFLSTGAAGVLFCFLLESLGLGWAAAPLLGAFLLGWWAIPPTVWKAGTVPFRRPVLYGLAAAFCWTFLRLATRDLFEPSYAHQLMAVQLWPMGRILQCMAPGLLLGIVMLAIARRLKVDIASGAGLGLLLAWAGLTAAGFQAPGVPAMLFVLVLAMEAREPVLVALAGIAGGMFLSHFYYDLHTTLLAKSGILVASGALLLALRFWMGRKEAR